MSTENKAVVSVESFGISQNDLNEIWRKYIGLHDGEASGMLQISGRVRPFATNRVGYLGDHFILELESKQQDTVDKVELFLKALPSGIQVLTDYLQSIGTARKESLMYRELLPQMRSFSRFAPQCFYSSAPDGRLLVLENLQQQGFRSSVTVSSGTFDQEHLECAIAALAKFHSASLLLETKTGKSLTQLAPGVLVENAWIQKEDNPRMLELDNAIEVLLALVRIVENENPRLKTILEKLPAFMKQIYDYVKPSHEYRNVACHGDLWANNMMFRYDDASGRAVPVECLIIDFQFARYAPPAYDLNMLITLTTTGEFRQIHRSELIRFYYKCIREELQKHSSLNTIPDELCREESFFKSCDLYIKSGLIENFLMNHVTLLPRSYVNTIFSSSECYTNFTGDAKIRMCLEVLEKDKVYRERIVGIIRDLIEAV